MKQYDNVWSFVFLFIVTFFLPWISIGYVQLNLWEIMRYPKHLHAMLSFFMQEPSFLGPYIHYSWVLLLIPLMTLGMLFTRALTLCVLLLLLTGVALGTSILTNPPLYGMGMIFYEIVLLSWCVLNVRQRIRRSTL